MLDNSINVIDGKITPVTFESHSAEALGIITFSFVYDLGILRMEDYNHEIIVSKFFLVLIKMNKGVVTWTNLSRLYYFKIKTIVKPP